MKKKNTKNKHKNLVVNIKQTKHVGKIKNNNINKKANAINPSRRCRHYLTKKHIHLLKYFNLYLVEVKYDRINRREEDEIKRVD